jgi:hypothetical protein
VLTRISRECEATGNNLASPYLLSLFQSPFPHKLG